MQCAFRDVVAGFGMQMKRDVEVKAHQATPCVASCQARRRNHGLTR